MVDVPRNGTSPPESCCQILIAAKKFFAAMFFPSETNPLSGELTHFDEAGASRIVDVSAKPITDRYARAGCVVAMRADTLRLVVDRRAAKGDVAEVARLAGIMAAKQTGALIPLCHPLPLSSVTIHIRPTNETTLLIEAEVRTTGQTGVEMEAMTAVTVAALTVYDMLKAVDREIQIDAVRLLEKRGGKSGHYLRP